jgi:arylsulfatase A-like enzyme
MSSSEAAPPRREPLGTALGRAAGLAALSGAAIGLVESAKVLAMSDARYVQWAARLVCTGTLGYALVAALLALPCALAALALHGRPQHRAIPASACAALGSTIAVALFALAGWISAELALPAALAATAAALALKELLAWWPFVTRASTWWALVGVGSAACIALIASRFAQGAYQAAAWALALVNLGLAIPTLRGSRAPHAAMCGGLALLGLVSISAPERRVPEVSSAGKTDVLVVSIDTLRADALGCYGNPRARTPNIDALAAQGVLFEDASAQANTTVPSHVTMLTGLYPIEHGAVSNGRAISNRARTLADHLSRTHHTGAFVSGFTLVDDACGLAPRFDWYDDQLLAWRWLPRTVERLHLVGALIRFAERRGSDVRRADRPAAETVDAALEWWSTRGDEPLFTFVHLYDPHVPYEPPADYARLHDPKFEQPLNWYELDAARREALISDPAQVERMKALYAGEVSYADAQLGRLIDNLRERGRLERTLIVLASDHGEGMGSHGYWFDHGTFLFDEELHVPLVLRFPDASHQGRRVREQVRILDVTPTVLDVLGIAPTTPLSGASLALLAQGAPDARRRPSFALADIAGNLSGFTLRGQRQSLRTGRCKLIWTSSHWLDAERVPEREEYFTLDTDPDELVNLRADGAIPAQPFDELQRDLGAWRAQTAPAGSDAELRDDVVEQLRKLGYL